MPMSRSAMLIASPMPRVPPVTIATRAMRSLRFLPLGRLFLVQPPGKFAADQFGHHLHAFGRVVEAVEQRELLAAGVEECVSAADSELFQCLYAIGGKARGSDGDALHPLARISRESRIGGRLKPSRSAELRLESDVDCPA